MKKKICDSCSNNLEFVDELYLYEQIVNKSMLFDAINVQIILILLTNFIVTNHEP